MLHSGYRYSGNSYTWLSLSHSRTGWQYCFSVFEAECSHDFFIRECHRSKARLFVSVVKPFFIQAFELECLCFVSFCVYFIQQCWQHTHTQAHTDSNTHCPFVPLSPASLFNLSRLPPSLLTRWPGAGCQTVPGSDVGDIIFHNESTATSSSTVHCASDSERPCPGGVRRWRGTLHL